MKQILKLIAGTLLLGIVIFISCKKVPVTTAPAANEAPIAKAGPYQTIGLPANTVILDGSSSSDPDNNIISYSWTKFAGPYSFNITTPNSAKTKVTNLVVGTYRFELKVTDPGGLSSKDTVQVTVGYDSPPVANCDAGNRPSLNATLSSIGTLSVPRFPAVGALGSKVVFAGGRSGYSIDPDYQWQIAFYSAIDIYDVNSRLWSTAQLSIARADIGVISNGNKIFFAGGTGKSVYDNIDIYDVSSNTWTLAHLSEPGSSVATAALGSKVFFASWQVVDIYDLSTNQWSTVRLPVPRTGLIAATAGNKVYFAGGNVKTIDIYDNAANTWSTSTLQYLWGEGISGIGVGDNIYWAGLGTDAAGVGQSKFVEIRNVTTGNTTTGCLTYDTYKPGIALRNDDIVFFDGREPTSLLDIYNTTTGKWSTVRTLNAISINAGFVSLNNTIYAAGRFNDNSPYTSQVYTLTW